MKGKINRLKEIRIELDKITEDCFQDHYPSYISNGLNTALSIVNDNLKELKKYESKNIKIEEGE
tara:strand:+ start:528 stop:719 length:192 start_codon:yes stop_codon:yes gene_type:complete